MLASPTIPLLSKTPEIALFVGFPCLGKSSFYRKHFGPAGYIHINQDTLKSRDKCIKAAEEASKSGKSCVIGLSEHPYFATTVTVICRQHQS